MTSSGALRTEILALLQSIDPEAMTGAQAVALVQDLAVVEKAAATGRMFAAVRVAQTDAWRGQGHASAADWLAAQAGVTVREASAQLGTARRAAGLPKTKERMRAGKLSPTQAAAVTEGASADPDAEAGLLEAAEQDTTAELKAEAARARAAATDSATRERRIRAERSMRTRTDADGAFCLHLRGPAADGVRLQALLKPFEEQAFRTGRTDGVRNTYENRSYDAFQALIGQIAAGDAEAAGATAGRAPAGGTPPGPAGPDASAEIAPRRRRPGGNNVKVIVRIDHTALLRGRTIAGETCEVAGLGPISVSAVQELLQSDPFLAAVVTKGRDVVNVAHLGRVLSRHQRTAIEAMGLRCSNRACNRTVALQIDHRVPYGDIPETKLSNQDPLCPDCHRRKTHHGWRLEPGTGPRRFLPPADPGAVRSEGRRVPDQRLRRGPPRSKDAAPTAQQGALL